MGSFKSRPPRLGYTRPATDLGSDVLREWKEVLVKELEVGDIVSGKGKVIEVFEACDGTYYLEAGEATDDFFDPDTKVFAFVKRSD